MIEREQAPLTTHRTSRITHHARKPNFSKWLSRVFCVRPDTAHTNLEQSPRHCERSAAVHDCAFSAMDRRTSFAMTNQGRIHGKFSASGPIPHTNHEPSPRHCERSAAVHDCAFSAMDRRTSFAMTNQGRVHGKLLTDAVGHGLHTRLEAALGAAHARHHDVHGHSSHRPVRYMANKGLIGLGCSAAHFCRGRDRCGCAAWSRPERNSTTALATARATLRASSCTASSRSSAS